MGCGITRHMGYNFTLSQTEWKLVYQSITKIEGPLDMIEVKKE